MRRVVTGEDEMGRSRLVSDGPAAVYASRSVPGLISTPLWATLGAASFDRSGFDPIPSLGPTEDLPEPGETRFFCVEFPPDSVFADPTFDPAAAAAEQARNSPRFAALFSSEHPGVHRAGTVDYHIVLAGTIVLELDDEEVELHTGDVIVQNGARHAWRNRTDSPVLLGIVWVAPPA
jgi:mannose-6-phosphate isomerase-like protein (cupin superfamily)